MASAAKVEVKTGDVERKSSVSAVLFCWRRLYTDHIPLMLHTSPCLLHD